MSEYLIKGETLTAIADPTRSLSGSTAQLTPAQIASLLSDANSEVDSQTSLIEQINSVINGKVGSGGGAVETCTVTYFDGGCAVLGIYMSYVDGVYTPMVVWYPGREEPGGTFTNVVKNSIFALYIGDYSMTETDGAELVIQEDDTFLAYHIQDNANIYVE